MLVEPRAPKVSLGRLTGQAVATRDDAGPFRTYPLRGTVRNDAERHAQALGEAPSLAYPEFLERLCLRRRPAGDIGPEFASCL
ncbi:hypothetical protein GCM10022221_35290 [Actinocorallia aurea]